MVKLYFFFQMRSQTNQPHIEKLQNYIIVIIIYTIIIIEHLQLPAQY